MRAIFSSQGADPPRFHRETRLLPEEKRAHSRLIRGRTEESMSQYRCYLVDGRQTIVSVEILYVATDDEARHEARWLFFDRGDADGGFEIWLRDRLVERHATPISVY